MFFSNVFNTFEMKNKRKSINLFMLDVSTIPHKYNITSVMKIRKLYF